MPDQGSPSADQKGAALLRALTALPLMRGALPARQRRRAGELPSASDGLLRQSGFMLPHAVPNFREVEGWVRELGQLRYLPAVPALVRLWDECPIMPIWQAAGAALLQLGTAEAHAALQSSLDEEQYFARSRAIESIIIENHAAAFDRLAPYFDEAKLEKGEVDVARDTLHFFGPWSYTAPPEERRWRVPTAPEWLRADPRWIELALRLRDHRHVAVSARHLLTTLSPEELDEAHARWPDPAPSSVRKLARPLDSLARYQQGDHVAVWHELTALGRIEDEDVRAEAMAVAMATMGRVRTNIQLVEQRLKAAGYRFGGYGFEFKNPPVHESITRIEKAIGGRLPISLVAFWKVVGDVTWVHEAVENPYETRYASLPLPVADPLVVYPVEAALYELEEWKRRRTKRHPLAVGKFEVPLAPDYLHKANISGGGPYQMAVPNDGIDGYLINEAHDLYFVDYLRLCFRRGGFSALEPEEMTPEGKEFLEALTMELVAF